MKARFLLAAFIPIALATAAEAQPGNWLVKPPFYLLHFGSGAVADVNTVSPVLYSRVPQSCPRDGEYALTPSTSNCFRGDWHTLTEDHTPGDAGGNMLLVNSAYTEGVFLSKKITGFVGGKTYQFSMWLMNVCRPSNKCPFPLLPNLVIRLETPAGKPVAQFETGELVRSDRPVWLQRRALFTMPAAETALQMIFSDSAPGGCGNDFALDDIAFSECTPVTKSRELVPLAKRPEVVTRAPPKVTKEKNKTPIAAPPRPQSVPIALVAKPGLPPVAGRPPNALPVNFAPVPAVLQQRKSNLAKTIVTGEGDILIDLYDNGEIDGDTVSIYHNNVLIVSKQRLSQKPISFRIRVDKSTPVHELVMVADNLGSIPPNTSLMIVTANEKRYQVFISSTEQQNVKVVLQLNE